MSVFRPVLANAVRMHVRRHTVPLTTRCELVRPQNVPNRLLGNIADAEDRAKFNRVALSNIDIGKTCQPFVAFDGLDQRRYCRIADLDQIGRASCRECSESTEA